MEARSKVRANAVPILESLGLPQPNTITMTGINSWIKQVICAFEAAHPAVLADSCLSMYRNTQILNAWVMDMMRASGQTYGIECSKLVESNQYCESELPKLKEEYALHMRSCQERSQRFQSEKEELKRKINDLTRSSSGNGQLSEATKGLNQATNMKRGCLNRPQRKKIIQSLNNKPRVHQVHLHK